jgi:hypothetical protein
VELHQNASASSDLSFDARLSAVRNPPPPAPTPLVVVPRGAVWRYRNVGPAPAATWTTPGFDDTTWLQGPAILGREQGATA